MYSTSKLVKGLPHPYEYMSTPRPISRQYSPFMFGTPLALGEMGGERFLLDPSTAYDLPETTIVNNSSVGWDQEASRNMLFLAI
jgi:hypothetical protein